MWVSAAGNASVPEEVKSTNQSMVDFFKQPELSVVAVNDSFKDLKKREKEEFQKDFLREMNKEIYIKSMHLN